MNRTPVAYDFTIRPTREMEKLDIDFATFTDTVAKTVDIPKDFLRSEVAPRLRGIDPGINKAIRAVFTASRDDECLSVREVHSLVTPYSLNATRIELFKMRLEGELACKVSDNKLTYFKPWVKG